AMEEVIRDETIIEKDIAAVFGNQLSLLPDKYLVDLYHQIESYQVTKKHKLITSKLNREADR
ncbi:MAG: hypothetical protein ACKPAE_04190, partial [Microcystis panniformis]